jgi:hypothetical protein
MIRNKKAQSPQVIAAIVILLIIGWFLLQSQEKVTVSVIPKDQNIIIGEDKVTFLYDIINKGDQNITYAKLRIDLPNNAAIEVSEEITPIPSMTERRAPVSVDGRYWKEGTYEIPYTFTYTTQDGRTKIITGTTQINVYSEYPK